MCSFCGFMPEVILIVSMTEEYYQKLKAEIQTEKI
jgi:hypothetical protein